MKKWFSTILFIFFMILSYPIYNLAHHEIYNFYFKQYGSSNLWSVYYDKVQTMQIKVFIIIAIGFGIVYIWNIISSFYQMKHGEVKTLLKQTKWIQCTTLFVQIIIVLLAMLGTIIGFMNFAILLLPLLWLLVIFACCMLGLVGSLRGLATVVRAKRESLINSKTATTYEILQFIPIAKLVDTIILSSQLKKANNK